MCGNQHVKWFHGFMFVTFMLSGKRIDSRTDSRSRDVCVRPENATRHLHCFTPYHKTTWCCGFVALCCKLFVLVYALYSVADYSFVGPC